MYYRINQIKLPLRIPESELPKLIKEKIHKELQKNLSKTGTSFKDGTASKSGSSFKDGTVSKEGTASKDGTSSKTGTSFKDGTASESGSSFKDGTAFKSGTSFKDGTASKIRSNSNVLNDLKVSDWYIVKKSLDARDKGDIHYVYTVDFTLSQSDISLPFPEGKKEHYEFPNMGENPLKHRPVICGFGPAGMFAGLVLAQKGYRPIIIERGSCMQKRVAYVDRFWKEGVLDTASNVQFGEGGAGTFSDGKLTTNTKDKRISKVLMELVNAGANQEILYLQKPHIGTDKLRDIVVNIRNEIIRLGGEIYFDTKLVGVITENGKLEGIRVECNHQNQLNHQNQQNQTKEANKLNQTNQSNQTNQTNQANQGEQSNVFQDDSEACKGENINNIETDVLILAIGHSARDTFKNLYAQGLEMLQKPFSIGMRIEHPQRLIDIAQYGKTHEELSLPPAEYKLAHHLPNGRGVYTFCMCPGGEVVNASSCEGMIVVNGMSESMRDGKYANSALLCDVRTDDFGSEHPLAGIDFQEKYEKLAFENSIGAYKPPKCTWGDLSEYYKATMEGAENSNVLTDANALARSIPSFALESIMEAMPIFARKLRGFDDKNARLYAVESRSSSPVRIPRNEEFVASIDGIYPAGEGAGYAGGIVSAGVDGIRCAEAIIKAYYPNYVILS